MLWLLPLAKAKVKMLSNYIVEFAFGKLQDEKTQFFRQ